MTDIPHDPIGGPRRRWGLSCAELLELTTDYIDGALPEGDIERFEAHLRTCEGCTIVLDQLRKQLELTGQLDEAEIPAADMDRLLDAFTDWQSSRRDEPVNPETASGDD